MKCAQPGCGGTVVDGYCDVWGCAGRQQFPAARVTAAGHLAPSRVTSQVGTIARSCRSARAFDRG